MLPWPPADSSCSAIREPSWLSAGGLKAAEANGFIALTGRRDPISQIRSVRGRSSWQSLRAWPVYAKRACGSTPRVGQLSALRTSGLPIGKPLQLHACASSRPALDPPVGAYAATTRSRPRAIGLPTIVTLILPASITSCSAPEAL
jgi:hypothetical protein